VNPYWITLWRIWLCRTNSTVACHSQSLSSTASSSGVSISCLHDLPSDWSYVQLSVLKLHSETSCTNGFHLMYPVQKCLDHLIVDAYINLPLISLCSHTLCYVPTAKLSSSCWQSAKNGNFCWHLRTQIVRLDSDHTLWACVCVFVWRSINNPTPKKSAVSVAAYTANSIILTMRYYTHMRYTHAYTIPNNMILFMHSDWYYSCNWNL